CISDSKVIIKDFVRNNGGGEFILECASNMSLRHVASGKFFTYSDLSARNNVYTGKNEYYIEQEIGL
ncbi:MAG: hypothetical protein K2N67_07330, partial [Mucispirillum sp.]|nr:hypothetical protein [Mucispirillum sp.]